MTNEWDQKKSGAWVTAKIEKIEKTAVQTGGRGHLGFVSYAISEIEPTKQVAEGWKIIYHYTFIH
jgi:hypothetical protein